MLCYFKAFWKHEQTRIVEKFNIGAKIKLIHKLLNENLKKNHQQVALIPSQNRAVIAFLWWSYLSNLQGLLLLLATLQSEPPGRPSGHGNADKIPRAHFLLSVG